MIMFPRVKPALPITSLFKLEYLAKREDGSYTILAKKPGSVYYIHFSRAEAKKLQELISKDLGYWPEDQT